MSDDDQNVLDVAGSLSILIKPNDEYYDLPPLMDSKTWIIQTRDGPVQGCFTKEWNDEWLARLHFQQTATDVPVRTKEVSDRLRAVALDAAAVHLAVQHHFPHGLAWSDETDWPLGDSEDFFWFIQKIGNAAGRNYPEVRISVHSPNKKN
jgi:hypothetical protein